MRDNSLLVGQVAQNIWHRLWGRATMTDYHQSNIARNRSSQVRVKVIVDDEIPPRGRDMPRSIIYVPRQSCEPIIQENLERLMTAAHLENVLNKMAAVVQE